MLKVFTFIDGVEKKFDSRTLEQAKIHCISDISQLATSAISESGIDAISQQNASLGIYPVERCEAIKSYIAACRNEYLRCKTLILAAQTNDEADAIQYVAPPVPKGI